MLSLLQPSWKSSIPTSLAPFPSPPVNTLLFPCHIRGHKLPMELPLRYGLFSWTIERRLTCSTIAFSPTRSYLSIYHVVLLARLTIFSRTKVNVWNFLTIVSQSRDLCHPAYPRAPSWVLGNSFLWSMTSAPQIHKHGNMSTTLPLQTWSQRMVLVTSRVLWIRSFAGRAVTSSNLTLTSAKN